MNSLLAFLIMCIFAASGWSAEAPASNEEQRAVAALEQTVKTDPGNAELWTHLGFAFRKAGQIDQAASAFNKAVSLDPHSEDALYMLGLIYESKHDKENALRAWKNYLSTQTDANKRAIAETHIHHLGE